MYSYVPDIRAGWNKPKQCFNSVFPFINRLGMLAILNPIFNIFLQVFF